MAAALIMPFAVSAQEAEEQEKEEGYVFTTVKEIPVTSVKDQNNSGTCWCYSGLGFIEAELIRMGKGEYDLSEMYIVHKTYDDRAMAAVRTHGDVSFSQGGSFYDVIYGMKTFGVVPEEVMRPGVMYNDSLADHSELSALTDAMVKAIAKGDHRMLQSNAENEMLWAKAVKAVHDVYLGECPEEFTYNGKNTLLQHSTNRSVLTPMTMSALHLTHIIPSTRNSFSRFRTLEMVAMLQSAS